MKHRSDLLPENYLGKETDEIEEVSEIRELSPEFRQTEVEETEGSKLVITPLRTEKEESNSFPQTPMEPTSP